MLRAEYILILHVHQGQTYSPKIISFLYHRGYIPSQREDGWEIRSKETRGEGG